MVRAGYRFLRINGRLGYFDRACRLRTSSYEQGEWSFETWSDSIIIDYEFEY